ncbi:MAG: UbiA family prenyltransferase [Cyclobacteriaceae bacterium]
MQRSTWLHLRIPFSFFLLPVFLFAISILENPDWWPVILVGVILHLLLYPASNGYNSYFDKDEGSIGGLKHPPKVSKELYVMALVFDGIALVLGLWISWQFALMLFVYGLVSKAYSHPAVRLKKLPIIGWITAGFFQGYFTFLMVIVGVGQSPLPEMLTAEVQLPAILSSLLLWGSYPMTQVYQHEEDAARGDQTISLRLGVLGTFHFTAAMFSLSNAGFLAYYYSYFGLTTAMMFQAFLLPVLVFFLWWYLRVRREESQANFEHTMQLNMLSAVMLNAFFLTVTLLY